jgi:hypothetical protein
VVLELHVVRKLRGRGRRAEVESEFGESRVGNEEFEGAFQFEGPEAAVSEEGEGEGFADGDMHAEGTEGAGRDEGKGERKRRGDKGRKKEGVG